jgi:hypothetical protein
MPEHHFTFPEGADLEKVRKAYQDMKQSAASFDIYKVFNLASLVNKGLQPAKEIYQAHMFHVLRFGDKNIEQLTDIDKELINYKVHSLEILARDYILEAFGGPENPMDTRIVQYTDRKLSGKKDNKTFFEMHFETPQSEEPTFTEQGGRKKRERTWIGTRYNNSIYAFMNPALITGSCYRDDCLGQAKIYATEGVKFCPTYSLLDSYRVASRFDMHPHDPRETRREKLVSRDVARVAFLSGVTEYTFSLLGESLSMGEPYLDEDIVDFYHLIKLGVETGRVPESVVEKLNNDESFHSNPEYSYMTYLPIVKADVSKLLASEAGGLKIFGQWGEQILKGYEKTAQNDKGNSGITVRALF